MRRSWSWVPVRLLRYYAIFFVVPWLFGFVLIAGAEEKRKQGLESALQLVVHPQPAKNGRPMPDAPDQAAIDVARHAKDDAQAARDASLILGPTVPLAGAAFILALGYVAHLYRRWRHRRLGG